MALTYAQSATLMKDPTFIDRVKVAVLKYANFILAEALTVPQHNARHRWAVSASLGPDSVAQIVAQPVVMDAQVQTDGGAITDANLQTSVEAVLNSSII
jgi:hypothetical protein